MLNTEYSKLKLGNRRFRSVRSDDFILAGAESDQATIIIKNSKHALIKALAVQFLIGASPTAYGFTGAIVYITHLNGEKVEALSIGGSLVTNESNVAGIADLNLNVEQGETITLAFINGHGTQGVQITASLCVEEYDVLE